MARLADDILPPNSEGTLSFTTSPNGQVTVLYTLSEERLELWNLLHESDHRYQAPPPTKARLLEIDSARERLTIFPLKTSYRSFGILEPKYPKLKAITVADPSLVPLDDFEPIDVALSFLLEDLPSCFVKDWDYGLGFVKQYSSIVSSVEQLTQCSVLLICASGPDAITMEGPTLHMPTEHFDTIRRSIGRTISNSQTAAKAVKDGTTYNYIASQLDLPTKAISIGRHPLRQQVTRLCLDQDEPLSAEEQEKLVDALSKSSGAFAQLRPETLARLQFDIELVALDLLIARFKSMLEEKHHESIWQEFLEENAFVLTLAFGYPIVKVGEQVAVGGRRLTGGGETLADFLVKNSRTNSAALIEIKTPQTKLLSSTEYRSGVYAPSSELTGAIAQSLDQKQHFEEEFVQLRHNSEASDIESYSVQCCLIVGTLPTEKDKVRSFELFRRDSKSVAIITFNELLDKIRSLREFLISPPGDPREDQRKVVPDDLPFP